MGGKGLNGVPTSKIDVMRFESPATHVPGLGLVEAVNGVSNYFKHHDEWPHDWVVPSNSSSAATIRIVTNLGLEPHASGNLLAVVRVLGGDEVSGIVKVMGDLGTWRNAISSRIRSLN